MSEAERSYWAGYIAELAGRLRLRDWTIKLSEEPATPSIHGAESGGSIIALYGQKHATLALGVNWESFPPEQKRHTITHELLHLHLEGMDDVVFFNVRPRLKAPVWEVIKEDFLRSLEFAVDGLADAVAPLMPLPLQSMGVLPDGLTS